MQICWGTPKIEISVRKLLKLVLKNAVLKNRSELSLMYDQIEIQIGALGVRP